MHDPFLPWTRTRRSAVGIAAAILLTFAVGLLVGSDSGHLQRSRQRAPDTVLVPPPTSEVVTLLTNTPLAIAPQDALAINAARALAPIKVIPARPFFLPPLVETRPAGPAAALDCLTKAVYYEAAVESETGQRAVAQVVLNRLRSPIFPHSVCGVVFQGSELRTGCQFSFTCDGSLARQPSLSGWMRARRVALAALSGQVERSVGLATHYHADYVVPYWASSLDKTTTIGAHIFYTMRGGLGRPVGFGARYDPLREAPPAPTSDSDAVVDGAVAAATGEPVGLAPPKPRDRTIVIEDALGTAPVAPNLPAPAATLKADEGRGQLAADANRGAEPLARGTNVPDRPR